MKSSTQSNPRRKSVLTVREIAVFAMLGALMYASKAALDALPNIHLVGMFVMVVTVVYRVKALFPIYIYVILCGLFGVGGFGVWWVSQVYIWLPLWAVTLALPREMKKGRAMVVYPLVCGLFGLAYGTLYAPGQALMLGFDFKQTIAWIAAGLPFDVIHAVSNVAVGLLVLPVSKVVMKLEKSR